MACCFAGWVYWYYGERQAYMWMSGYMLEWMLSFDNLFVFHLIFNVYSTPDSLKHRPLYLGIIGAVVFRLVFIFVGEYLMHAFFFMHFIFGGFLVWTGIKTMTADDEDEDPSQHPLVLWLQKRVPLLNAYDSRGSFFVRVAVDEAGEPLMPKRRASTMTEEDPLVAGEGAAVYDFEADLSERMWTGNTQTRYNALSGRCLPRVQRPTFCGGLRQRHCRSSERPLPRIHFCRLCNAGPSSDFLHHRCARETLFAPQVRGRHCAHIRWHQAHYRPHVPHPPKHCVCRACCRALWIDAGIDGSGRDSEKRGGQSDRRCAAAGREDYGMILLVCPSCLCVYMHLVCRP